MPCAASAVGETPDDAPSTSTVAEASAPREESSRTAASRNAPSPHVVSARWVSGSSAKPTGTARAETAAALGALAGETHVADDADTWRAATGPTDPKRHPNRSSAAMTASDVSSDAPPLFRSARRLGKPVPAIVTSTPPDAGTTRGVAEATVMESARRVSKRAAPKIVSSFSLSFSSPSTPASATVTSIAPESSPELSRAL